MSSDWSIVMIPCEVCGVECEYLAVNGVVKHPLQPCNEAHHARLRPDRPRFTTKRILLFTMMFSGILLGFGPIPYNYPAALLATVVGAALLAADPR